MSDFADIARALWAQSREETLGHGERAVALTLAWSTTHQAADLTEARPLVHRLAGTLGTFAAALRGTQDGPDPAIQAAGDAAVALEAAISAPDLDSELIVAAALELRAALTAL